MSEQPRYTRSEINPNAAVAQARDAIRDYRATKDPEAFAAAYCAIMSTCPKHGVPEGEIAKLLGDFKNARERQ